MKLSKFAAVLLAVVVCLAGSATDARAQARGRATGRAAAGRAPAGRPAGTVGTAAPRPGGVYPGGVYSRFGRPYGYYPFRPGLSIGFYGGFGYYPWGYPYYYGYPYAYPYGYGYPGYGYAYPPAPGYDVAAGAVAYGGLKIQGAPRDGEVFVDGYYAGIVDDFDGALQHLNLQAGPHKVEIHAKDRPPVQFDVDIQPGQTITYHAEIK